MTINVSETSNKKKGSKTKQRRSENENNNPQVLHLGCTYSHSTIGRNELRQSVGGGEWGALIQSHEAGL